jgi:hypothetical protein
MPAEKMNTHEKALALNLDPRIYGTVAEIGAGQEVARWFFRVGGAAGTIAKTISTYDMTVSDQVYGKASRYVSRARLEAMLDHELGLLLERLGGKRANEQGTDETRLFAFADTVAARNRAGTNECHGWLGIRFQALPAGTPSDILLHVNMLDLTNLQQQEAIGILGVNLIHAAFFRRESLPTMLTSLMEDLSLERIEVDLVHLAGPAFEGIQPVDVGLTLVRGDIAQAVLFDPQGNLVPPTEVIRKRSVIVERGHFRRAEDVGARMLRTARDFLEVEKADLDREPLGLLELSVKSISAAEEVSDAEYQERIRRILGLDEYVLLTRLGEAFRLTGYLRRYSQQPLRFVAGVSTLALILHDAYYRNLSGGLLEGIGRLFADNVKIYAASMEPAAFQSHLRSAGVHVPAVSFDGFGLITANNLRFESPLGLLYQYLLEVGWIIGLPHA